MLMIFLKTEKQKRYSLTSTGSQTAQFSILNSLRPQLFCVFNNWYPNHDRDGQSALKAQENNSLTQLGGCGEDPRRTPELVFKDQWGFQGVRGWERAFHSKHRPTHGGMKSWGI